VPRVGEGHVVEDVFLFGGGEIRECFGSSSFYWFALVGILSGNRFIIRVDEKIISVGGRV
jgi:hypothetical protein